MGAGTPRWEASRRREAAIEALGNPPTPVQPVVALTPASNTWRSDRNANKAGKERFGRRRLGGSISALGSSLGGMGSTGSSEGKGVLGG